MVEKNKKTKTKDEKANKPEGKKVTVGAWWKSTVVEETKAAQDSQPEPDTKKAPAKRQARRPVAKTSAKSSAKPADKTTATTTEEVNKEKISSPVKAKSSTPTRQTTTAAAKSSASPVTAKETSEQGSTDEQQPKRTPRRRAPRKKKPVTPSLKTKSSAGLEVDTAVSEESKPVKKTSPRKKPRSASPGVSPSSQVDVTAQQTETDKLEPLTKKPARKRPPRKSASKKVEAATSVDTEIVEAKEGIDTEEKKPAEPKQKKRAPRKRAPRKTQTREKRDASAETIASSDGEVSATDEAATTDSTAINETVAVDAAEALQPDSGESDSNRAEADAASIAPEKRDRVDQGRKEKKEPKPVIKLLINAEEPEECRLALLEDGRLESIHVATVSRAQTKNNIYKARIVAIEANLQAAFVDYGTDKNGFLPFSEIHPEYYKQDVSEKIQKLIDQHQWKRLSIKDVVEKGQEVLVQVVKEEVGTKGANMTTYLSLPGRCVVLMPGSDSTGISRKISGEEARSQLREYIKSIDIPEGIGWIVRTASIDITKTALSRDVGYLLRLWEDVKKKGQDLDGAGLIYQDHNHVLRFLREHFDPDIQEILVDDKDSLEQVKKFVELLPSKQRNVRVKLHRGARPIFNQYSIEDQIESIYQPRVNLPSGGSIVIDPTEALVAIDVNSGSTSKGQNFEASIFQANMEAAKELARQLRLRDLGGLIVVDFIDMRANKNIREVERQVKTAMKRDKAKVDISRISKFGLMQISRQKLGAPIEAGNYRVCTHCKGRGMVRSVETLALYYLRRIHTGATRKVVSQIECHFPLDVAQYLLNDKRNELRELEAKYNAEVIIVAEPSFKPADNDIIFNKAEKDDSAKKRS